MLTLGYLVFHTVVLCRSLWSRKGSSGTAWMTYAAAALCCHQLQQQLAQGLQQQHQQQPGVFLSRPSQRQPLMVTQQLAAPARQRPQQKAGRRVGARRTSARPLHLETALPRVRQRVQQTGRKAALQVQPEAAAQREQEMLPQASNLQRMQRQQTSHLGQQWARQAAGCRLRGLELRTR